MATGKSSMQLGVYPRLNSTENYRLKQLIQSTSAATVKQTATTK